MDCEYRKDDTASIMLLFCTLDILQQAIYGPEGY